MWGGERGSPQKGLAHSPLGGLRGAQFPMDEELDKAGWPSQNIASLGLGGLGKERELSSSEAWFCGGGGRKTEQASPPCRASPPRAARPGHGPLYQQSSRRLSGGQGRPEQDGSGGALGGRGADTRGTVWWWCWWVLLLFFSTSSRHWTGTVAVTSRGREETKDEPKRKEAVVGASLLLSYLT